MASACMTSPSIWIGVALVAAKSQWLILGCSPSPRIFLAAYGRNTATTSVSR